MILPIFVMMLVGLFEFGWTQHTLSATRFALEDAARDLMINPKLTEGELQTRVRAQLVGVADQNVNVTMATATTSAGKVATLTGAYSRTIAIPMLPPVPLNFSVQVKTSLGN